VRSRTQPPFPERSISVSASIAAFHAAEAGAAPAWSAIFPSSRSVRVLHAAVRRRRFEVQVLAGAPFPYVDHVVTVASRPVKAAVPVQVRLINPVFIPRTR
jgi:hypothetical protein